MHFLDFQLSAAEGSLPCSQETQSPSPAKYQAADETPTPALFGFLLTGETGKKPFCILYFTVSKEILMYFPPLVASFSYSLPPPSFTIYAYLIKIDSFLQIEGNKMTKNSIEKWAKG